MWLTFWLENIHFALEFFASLVAFAAAWLFFDTWLMKKEPKIIMRSLGFLALAVYGVSHATGVSSDVWVWLTSIVYVVGLVCILGSLLLDVPPKIPTLSAVIMLPPASQAILVSGGLATVLLALVTVMAGRRYVQETAKSLGPFAFAFACFTIASAASLGSAGAPFGMLWVFEHVLRLAGFAALAMWVWQYLRFRIKEELLLVFITMALAIAVLVTFTFSALLLNALERDAEQHLATDVKVLDYAVKQQQNEALADARLLGSEATLIDAVVHGREAELDDRVKGAMVKLGLGFLTVADAKGNVLARGHAATKVGDDVSEEEAAGSALRGQAAIAVEATDTEGFSIRAAAPMYDGKRLVGLVVTGYQIDTALVERVKSVTGLESAVYQRTDGSAVEVATTMVGADGKSRGIGTKFTDSAVIQPVLAGGEGYVGRTEVLNKPYLAAYLPIMGTGDRAVGMMSVNKPQVSVLEATKSLNQLTLLATIVIMLITILPAYWVARSIGEQL